MTKGTCVLWAIILGVIGLGILIFDINYWRTNGWDVATGVFGLISFGGCLSLSTALIVKVAKGKS